MSNVIEFPTRVPSVADLGGALAESIVLTALFKQRHGDCVAVYDNDDAYSRQRAQEAYEQDRPAYWTSASYHSQKNSALQQYANWMPLDKALRRAHGIGADYIAALDTLIPLNDQAAIALVAQYSEYGVWKDLDELLMRRVRRMPPTRTTMQP